MIFPSLPLIKWVWTADGKRVQVWVWPKGHPSEMDIDVSDLVPADTIAEASDQHGTEFMAASMSIVATALTSDELPSEKALVQCGGASEPDQHRGGK